MNKPHKAITKIALIVDRAAEQAANHKRTVHFIDEIQKLLTEWAYYEGQAVQEESDHSARQNMLEEILECDKPADAFNVASYYLQQR